MVDVAQRQFRLSDIAYEAIKKDIIQKYTPGVPLSEREIAASLGISKTPVREALHELAQSGLIELIPGRGYFVRRFSYKDVKDIFEVREALENKAAFLAAPLVSDPDLVGIRELFDALRDQAHTADLAAMETAGDGLHELILQSARNERLVGILSTIKDQLDCIGRFTVRIPGRVPRSYQEHLAILDALGKRNPGLAEQAMRAHLESTKESVLQSLQ